MNMSLLSLQIAFRFSRGQRCYSMISLTSVLSVFGIMLGVSVLIIGLSAINGFEYELNNRILAVVPHGEIEPIDPLFIDWKAAVRRVKQVPGVLSAIPYLSFTGLIERSDKLQVIQIKGIDSKQIQLSKLAQYIHDTVWQQFQPGKKKIIIGQGIADALKVKQGDWLTVIIPNKNLKMTRVLQPKYINLQINGILALNSQLDRNFGLIPLKDAQQYLQRNQEIDGIAITVDDIFNANKLVKRASEVINVCVKMRTWISSYGYMYRDIQIIRIIVYMAMVSVIGLACFNIASMLVMVVKSKSADIAILRTLGSQNELIRAIFIWYGLLINLIGSSIGIIVSTLISSNLTLIANRLGDLLGRPLLSGDIYFIDFLPTRLRLIDVLSVFITTLIISILTSWYPTHRAILIDPARVLSAQ